MKPRVLLLGRFPKSTDKIQGGQAKFLANLMGSNLGRKFDLIKFSNARPLKKDVLNNSGYNVLLNSGFKRTVVGTLITLNKIAMLPFILIKSRPDIVQIHTSDYLNFWENSINIIIAKLFLRKVIVRFGGSMFNVFFERSPSPIKTLIRAILQLPDKIIVQSRFWESYFSKLVDKNKIVILPNCIDWRLYENKKRKKTSEYLDVLFLGSIYAKRKGIFDILKSIPLVLEKHSNIRFILVVPNKEIKALCSNKKFANSVVFKEWINGSEKLETFKNSDIYILPSYGEGFPNTILEAMASGLPVIATNVGAIPEVIIEGENGFLINPGDYQSLSNCLLELINNKRLREKMGENNVRKVKNQYDVSLVFEKLALEYEKIL